MNDERQPTNALLVSVAEAARRVGLGRTKVYLLIDAGKFPHKRIGRALRVPVKALEQWPKIRHRSSPFVQLGVYW